MIVGDALKEVKELEKIEDPKERISIACERFNKGTLQAKVIRMLYEKTMFDDREFFLDLLYAKETRQDNMKRLPPQLLLHKGEVANIFDKKSIDVYAKLMSYHFLYVYMTSKTQDKFLKIKNIMNRFESEHLFDIYYDRKYYKNVIKQSAMSLFFKELISPNQEQEVSPLHLPTTMTIGVEIECIGAIKQQLIDFRDKLRQNGIYDLDGFRIKNDGSLKDKNGNNNRIRSCKWYHA